jgi:hypothetical protein
MAPIVDRSNDASPTYIYFRNSEILGGKIAALVLVVHLGRWGGVLVVVLVKADRGKNI